MTDGAQTCARCIAPLPLGAARADGVVTCPYCGTDNRLMYGNRSAPAAERAPSGPNVMPRAIALAVGIAVVAWIAHYLTR